MNLSGMAEVIHHRLHRGVIGDIPGGTGGESDIRGSMAPFSTVLPVSFRAVPR
ncbi:Uncharacterised protein [Escherichia coli]|nr:Uncharacterised protein [Escherichia coli]